MLGGNKIFVSQRIYSSDRVGKRGNLFTTHCSWRKNRGCTKKILPMKTMSQNQGCSKNRVYLKNNAYLKCQFVSKIVVQKNWFKKRGLKFYTWKCVCKIKVQISLLEIYVPDRSWTEKMVLKFIVAKIDARSECIKNHCSFWVYQKLMRIRSVSKIDSRPKFVAWKPMSVPRYLL